MTLRLFGSVLLLSPFMLAPTLVFKFPLWTHESGMLGALVGLILSYCLTGLVYCSENFSKDFLMHRGATSRKSIWAGVCGVKTNAELWLLALAEGYWLGLNIGALFKALSMNWEISLPLGVFAAISVLFQVLLLVGFCYAPLLRFIGFSTAKMYSPLESVLCGLAGIVLAEFLGCAFAAYSAGVYVLGLLMKDTVMVYVLGIYAAILCLMGLGIALRAVVYSFLRRRHSNRSIIELNTY